MRRDEPAQAELRWESVTSYHDGVNTSRRLEHYRARVPGGWLVQAVDPGPNCVAMVFVPDPGGEWQQVTDSSSLLRPAG